MEIEKSLLGPEIDRIVNKKVANNTNEVTHRLIVHTVKNDIEISRVVDLEVVEDYNMNYTDEIFVNFLCPMGDFVKLIYPYRNNLEISVVKTVNGTSEAERYKLVLLNINENYGSGKYKEKSLQDLNEEEAKSLKGQCLDRSIEAIRLKNVEGIYRDHDMEEVLLGLFNIKLREIKVNGVNIDPLVNMIKANNKRLYNHILIPSGTKLVDLPMYLQENDYGVYNGHIGLYIKQYQVGTYFSSNKEKKLNVFLYPLYRTDVVDEVKNKLIIYNVPNFKYSMVESTYLIDGNDIKIIASQDSKKINTGDDQFMNEGVGYVLLEASSVMNRPVDVREDMVNNTKASNNVDNYMKDRADGSHYRTPKEPNDNLYHIRSDYLKVNGDIVQVKWNFSNTKYLIPGMGVIYTYLGDNNNVVRLNGVLQSHYTVYNQATKMCSTILNIFVEKNKDEEA